MKCYVTVIRQIDNQTMFIVALILIGQAAKDLKRHFMFVEEEETDDSSFQCIRLLTFYSLAAHLVNTSEQMR